jgi:hypothetical protein
LSDPHQEPVKDAWDSFPESMRPFKRTGLDLWLAPIDLFFRPRRFFRGLAEGVPAVVIVILFWTAGMTHAMDRLERMMIQGRYPELFRSWESYWAIVGMAGAASGLLLWAIGGWWYRQRLRFCGVAEPDRRMSRLVYVSASQIVAGPGIVYALVATVLHPGPVEASNAAGWGAMAMLVLPFWSALASYIGVRTVFGASRGKALVWFLVLPWCVYGVAMAAVVAAVAMVSSGPAPAFSSQRFEGAAFAFEYPGNWSLDTEFEEYDPDADVFIGHPLGGSFRVRLYETESDALAEVRATLEGHEGDSPVVEGAMFSTWASFQGSGMEGRWVLDGTAYVIRAFATEVRPGVLLEINEYVPETGRHEWSPALEVIRSNFRLRDPAPAG